MHRNLHFPKSSIPQLQQQIFKNVILLNATSENVAFQTWTFVQFRQWGSPEWLSLNTFRDINCSAWWQRLVILHFLKHSFPLFSIIDIVIEPLANKWKLLTFRNGKGTASTTRVFCQVYREESETIKPKDLIQNMWQYFLCSWLRSALWFFSRNAAEGPGHQMNREKHIHFAATKYRILYLWITF